MRRSLLDLGEAGPPPILPEDGASSGLEGPQEMFVLERPDDGGGFPIERALLFSLAAHVLILVLILSAPTWSPPDPRRGLLAGLLPPEKSEEEKIPVVFREAPGPARENPKTSPMSDRTRRAGGGDPSRARSESPFVPLRPGKEGLEPGRQTAPPRPGSGEPRERTASSFPAEKSNDGIEPFRILPPGPGSTGRGGAKLPGLDRAIREAAEGVGRQGEEGSGTPNPEGGFVDSGPLSFDTTWYDWGPYAEEMIRRIKLHWEIPELARLGWKGKLTIRFFILGDGRVEGAAIISRSGVPPFDFAALQAILKSSPFRPLPKDLGTNREGVTVTFFYNMRPGREGQQEGSR